MDVSEGEGFSHWRQNQEKRALECPGTWAETRKPREKEREGEDETDFSGRQPKDIVLNILTETKKIDKTEYRPITITYVSTAPSLPMGDIQKLTMTWCLQL